jgi:hypothetical protein
MPVSNNASAQLSMENMPVASLVQDDQLASCPVPSLVHSPKEVSSLATTVVETSLLAATNVAGIRVPCNVEAFCLILALGSSSPFPHCLITVPLACNDLRRQESTRQLITRH